LSKVCEKYDEMAEAGDLHAIDATRPVDEVVAEVLDYITTLDRSPAWSA